MFNHYESKPVTRMAHQITAEDTLLQEGESEWFIEFSDSEEEVWFKAYQKPVIGDWVVRLTEADTYHCTDAVFRERNIVP